MSKKYTPLNIIKTEYLKSKLLLDLIKQFGYYSSLEFVHKFKICISAVRVN